MRYALVTAVSTSECRRVRATGSDAGTGTASRHPARGSRSKRNIPFPPTGTMHWVIGFAPTEAACACHPDKQFKSAETNIT